MSIDLLVTLGRWQDVNDYGSVENLNFATLLRVAKEYWATSNEPADRATQVLIWDASNDVHNLIAVWTQDTGKLTLVGR